jgi:hypothetical protein
LRFQIASDLHLEMPYRLAGYRVIEPVPEARHGADGAKKQPARWRANPYRGYGGGKISRPSRPTEAARNYRRLLTAAVPGMRSSTELSVSDVV